MENTLELLRDLRLQVTARSGAPRAFLAGDIPRGTNVRAPVVIAVHRASSGHEPRRLEQCALEEICRRLGIRRGSLHDVCAKGPPGEVPCLAAAGGDGAIELLRALADLKSAVSRAHVNFATKRAPRDRVSRAHPAAISTRYLPTENTVLVVANRFSSFDTAFVDDTLIRGYGERGIGRIVVDGKVIWTEPNQILATARTFGLELVRSQG